ALGVDIVQVKVTEAIPALAFADTIVGARNASLPVFSSQEAAMAMIAIKINNARSFVIITLHFYAK
ncbi:MAG: hypothetical protein J6T58_04815, partial [Bacteroidales bacterium]|nr:hypothetical protein [Bacteroidales bacterium]